MGAWKGVTWPAMLEMWTIDLRGGFLWASFRLEEEGEEEERKWEIASWVVRIGWVRLMSRLA